MRQLEAAIHKYKGNEEDTKDWLGRFNQDLSVVKKLEKGQFLYYTGSSMEILEATKTFTNLED